MQGHPGNDTSTQDRPSIIGSWGGLPIEDSVSTTTPAATTTATTRPGAPASRHRPHSRRSAPVKVRMLRASEHQAHYVVQPGRGTPEEVCTAQRMPSGEWAVSDDRGLLVGLVDDATEVPALIERTHAAV